MSSWTVIYQENSSIYPRKHKMKESSGTYIKSLEIKITGKNQYIDYKGRKINIYI